MTVKELIEALKDCNPEAKVTHHYKGDRDGPPYYGVITSLKKGTGYKFPDEPEDSQYYFDRVITKSGYGIEGTEYSTQTVQVVVLK